MAYFSGFTNPMDSVIKGQASADSYSAALRKSTAYNALREQYGDAAGDPEAYKTLNSIDESQQKLPLELDRMRNVNDQALQKLDFDAQNNPLLIRSNQQTIQTNDQQIAQNEQMNPLRVQAAKNANQTQSNALSETQNDRQRTAITSILAGVEAKIDAGEDPAATFDSVAAMVAQMEGVPPNHPSIQQLRQQFIANPKGTIAYVNKAMAEARPDAAMTRANAATTLANAKAADVARKEKADAAKRGGGEVKDGEIERALTGDELADRTISDIKAAIPKVSKSQFFRSLHGAANKAGFPVNSTENGYIENLKTLAGTLGWEAIKKMKSEGVTFGALTEKEYERVAATVQRLQDARDVATVEKEVGILQTQMARLRMAREQEWKERPKGPEVMDRVRKGRSTIAPSGGGSAKPARTLDELLKEY